MIARGTIWRSKHLPKRRNDALPFRKQPQKRPPSFDSGLRLLTNPRRGMGRREASPLSIRFDGRRGASILWIEPSASRLIAGMENPPGFPPCIRQSCIFREKTLAFAEKNEYLRFCVVAVSIRTPFPAGGSHRQPVIMEGPVFLFAARVAFSCPERMPIKGISINAHRFPPLRVGGTENPSRIRLHFKMSDIIRFSIKNNTNQGLLFRSCCVWKT